jgi:hypothetical protein
MGGMGKYGGRGLPRAISAEKLQAMLRADPAFCSWDASHSMINDLTTRWPFLFSHLLVATSENKTAR